MSTKAENYPSKKEESKQKSDKEEEETPKNVTRLLEFSLLFSFFLHIFFGVKIIDRNSLLINRLKFINIFLEVGRHLIV